jgi:hypothetical protein
MAKKSELASRQLIEDAIVQLRGEKVLLDADLAGLYGVTTKALNQAVKRNRKRFPQDFMFRLTAAEAAALNRSQSVTGSQKHRDPRYRPFVFTEQGVAMLSSVLRSERAIQVNIAIMRVFQRLRRLLAEDSGLAGQVVEHERRITHCEGDIKTLIAGIPRLPGPAPEPRPIVGFTPPPKSKRRAKRKRNKTGLREARTTSCAAAAPAPPSPR